MRPPTAAGLVSATIEPCVEAINKPEEFAVQHSQHRRLRATTILLPLTMGLLLYAPLAELNLLFFAFAFPSNFVMSCYVRGLTVRHSGEQRAEIGSSTSVAKLNFQSWPESAKVTS